MSEVMNVGAMNVGQSFFGAYFPFWLWVFAQIVQHWGLALCTLGHWALVYSNIFISNVQRPKFKKFIQKFTMILI